MNVRYLESYRKKIHFIYFLIDTVLIALSFFIFYTIRFNTLIPWEGISQLNYPNSREYTLIFIIWGVLIIEALKKRNLYATDRMLTIPKEAYLVLKSVFYPTLFTILVIFLLKYQFFSRFVFLESFISISVFLVLWRVIKRWLLRILIRQGFNNLNVLIVGDNQVADLVEKEIQSRQYLGLKIVGRLTEDGDSDLSGNTHLPVLGNLSEFEWVCKKYFIDEIIITTYKESVIGYIFKKAQDLHLGIRVAALSVDNIPYIVSIDYLGFIPLFTYKERTPHPANWVVKRVFDFVASLILLFISFPLFLIIPLLIKIDSPGPILYRQRRVGRKGRVFYLYKFRSMFNNADKIKNSLLEKNEVKGGVIFKIRNDPRVTRIGRILRRYSLDELPQLINVLKGDMSLVGPRPFYIEETNRLIPKYWYRLSIRPGLTGLSQIRGRSDLSFYRWVRWDLWYVNNWSFGLDLWIMWRTVPVVMRGKGAY